MFVNLAILANSAYTISYLIGYAITVTIPMIALILLVRGVNLLIRQRKEKSLGR